MSNNKPIKLPKVIALAGFLIFFVSMVYLSTTGLRQERLGTFREDAKAQIDAAVRQVCSGLVDAVAGSCGTVSWGGKHRWFGRIVLEASSSQPSATAFAKVISDLGWSSAGASAGVVEYGRQDLKLSFYVVGDVVEEFTITTNR
jgi:hypothetical protein